MERVWNEAAVDPSDVSISFSKRDLDIFSNASGDLNPLHRSEEYARRTSYGQPVIFGCLGAVACLGCISLSKHLIVTSLQAEFRPIFLGVNYRVETTEEEGVLVARLFDGCLPVVSLTLTIRPASGAVSEYTPGTACFERQEAAARGQKEISPGLNISGKYAADPEAVIDLSKRWGKVDPFLTTILCWSSYLVGMELPGEAALFSKISLQFDRTVECTGKMEYRASVASLDTRFGQLRMDVALCAGARIIASGEFWSFLRPKLPEVEEIDPTGVTLDSLLGRSAVLVGASRGLGAAIKRALELRSATVYSVARSANGNEVPRMEVGDAADPQVMRRVRERVIGEQGRLDFLICNACPPLLPLRLESNSAERVRTYIDQAVWLTLTPLCSLLDLLNASSGCVVIISSLAVEKPVSEWPHYVAAKQAVEALARVASLQYPNIRTLIVRPPKLLTALTNTPMGRVGAASAGTFANRLATRLETALEVGNTEIFN